eukprot:CAMPEP_0170851208 /NCGR_PEP_ID=MMETSP0734-20130129/11093_1 /TAXON_ID=186038 /ORGANISM="Fragilariopsis kerguelensis, Strain L26-C5" /LENGTH=75 /DNA_ID=CAMNT_0011221277 /DNA_START=151 /DNA_END=378 /DNA_ORIENTATION=+
MNEVFIEVFVIVLFCIVIALSVQSDRNGRGYDYGNVEALYYDDVYNDETEPTVPVGKITPTTNHRNPADVLGQKV